MKPVVVIGMTAYINETVPCRTGPNRWRLLIPTANTRAIVTAVGPSPTKLLGA